MHRRTDEPSAAERDERAHAMCRGVATERDLGIAFVGEQAAECFADAVERGRRDIGRGDEQQRALRARGADIDTATATRRVGDAQLGHFGAEQCEHRVRVVAGVFVDREQLERDTEVAQILGGPLHSDTDGLLVITERQDDGDVEPRTVGHQARGLSSNHAVEI